MTRPAALLLGRIDHARPEWEALSDIAELQVPPLTFYPLSARTDTSHSLGIFQRHPHHLPRRTLSGRVLQRGSDLPNLRLGCVTDGAVLPRTDLRAPSVRKIDLP